MSARRHEETLGSVREADIRGSAPDVSFARVAKDGARPVADVRSGEQL